MFSFSNSLFPPILGSEDDWESATPEGDNNWVNITDLVPGQVYEMRVVALNGVGDRTESDVKLVVFGPKQGNLDTSVCEEYF